MEGRAPAAPVEVAPVPAVVPPPATSPAAPSAGGRREPPRKASIWRAIGVPLAIVVLVVIIWAVLAGMPYGSRHDEAGPPLRPSVETIGEGTTTTSAPLPPATATPPPQPLPPMTNTILMPEPQPPPATMPPVTATPPPVSTQPPLPAPVPQPPPPTPQPEPPPANEISAVEARGVLARYVDGHDPYHLPGNCIDVRGGDHVNRGYTFEVYDTCDSRRLGRWRVDGVTREVFEQKADGRYLPP